jgi:two-component system, LuxR family, response regulator FixJ
VRTIRAGALDFLTKPVNGLVLLARVQDALERCSALQEQEEIFQSIASRLATLTQREREAVALSVAEHNQYCKYYNCKSFLEQLIFSGFK